MTGDLLIIDTISTLYNSDVYILFIIKTVLFMLFTFFIFIILLIIMFLPIVWAYFTVLKIKQWKE